MRLVPINKLRSGNNPITISYEGDDIMNVAYVGGTLSFVRFAEYPKLKLDIEELSFLTAGGSEDVTVDTNANWSASTSASWLTIVTASTGFTVTASENDTEVDRDAVITVTAWNVNAVITSSITVSQPYITVDYVEYIYIPSAAWDASYSITLPIYPESDCEIRIIYESRGTSSDRIVGVTHADRPDGSDSKDFRIFNWGGGSIDVGDSRASNIGLDYARDTVWDITIGNRWVYNNKTSSYMSSPAGPYTMGASDTLIHVDVGSNKVNRVEIKNGGVVVFDGKAAVLEGVVGLYDTISNEIYTNSNLTLIVDR
jgi:hypothetical protein